MTITDADIEAACSFLETWEPGPERTQDKLAITFAAHRLSGVIEGRRQMREEAANATTCNGYGARGFEEIIAAAIRAIPLEPPA